MNNTFDRTVLVITFTNKKVKNYVLPKNTTKDKYYWSDNIHENKKHIVFSARSSNGTRTIIIIKTRLISSIEYKDE